jgi:hypothetical protein
MEYWNIGGMPSGSLSGFFAIALKNIRYQPFDKAYDEARDKGCPIRC